MKKEKQEDLYGPVPRGLVVWAWVVPALILLAVGVAWLVFH